MSSRWCGPVFLVACAAAVASGGRDEARYGTYVMYPAGLAQPTIDGQQLPSCGREAMAVLVAHAPMKIRYRRPDIARVNGEKWDVVQEGVSLFVREPATKEFPITVQVSRSGSLARGAIVFMKLDASRKPVCWDQLKLKGSYRE